MDLTIISTYRCDSKCSMCHIWKNPTHPDEEVSLDTLKKLPNNFDNINVSGGEPTLRKDLPEIIDLLYPKGRVIEISTNGMHGNRLEDILRKYKNIKIRFSIEGFSKTNDLIRGEQDGFNKKLAGMKRLQEIGGTDLGFGVVIQDENAEEIADLYNFTRNLGLDLATSALHNAFQFHKNDNYPYERMKVAKKVEKLIEEQLKSYSIKQWFRAYLNLGLIEKILGHDRLIPCTAATDFIFIDPWSDVYACNVRPDLLLGNFSSNSWDDLLNSEKAKSIRKEVSSCTQNCWMVTTARTAMRNKHLPYLPKINVLMWVIANKLRTLSGRNIDFSKYIDYGNIQLDPKVFQREKYLTKNVKRKLQHSYDDHYVQGDFDNR